MGTHLRVTRSKLFLSTYTLWKTSLVDVRIIVPWKVNVYPSTLVRQLKTMLSANWMTLTIYSILKIFRPRKASCIEALRWGSLIDHCLFLFLVLTLGNEAKPRDHLIFSQPNCMTRDKTLYSRTCIKRSPSIKQLVVKVPKAVTSIKVARNSFQHLYFDGSLQLLLITWCYNHGINKLPNHWQTRFHHFRDTIGYHRNSISNHLKRSLFTCIKRSHDVDYLFI